MWFTFFEDFLKRVQLDDVDITSCVNCIAALAEVPKFFGDQQLSRNLFTQVLVIASDFFSVGNPDKQLFGARLFKVFYSNNVCPNFSSRYPKVAQL